MASTSEVGNAAIPSSENVSGSIVCYLYTQKENTLFDKVVFLLTAEVQLDSVNPHRGSVRWGDEQTPFTVLFDDPGLSPEELTIFLNAGKLDSPERKLLVQMGRLRSAVLLQQNVLAQNPTAVAVSLSQVAQSPVPSTQRFAQMVNKDDVIIREMISESERPQHNNELGITRGNEDEEDDSWDIVKSKKSKRRGTSTKSCEPRFRGLRKEEIESGDLNRNGAGMTELDIYDNYSEGYELEEEFEDYQGHNSRFWNTRTKWGRKHERNLNTRDDWQSYLRGRVKEKNKEHRTRASLAVDISGQLKDFKYLQSLRKQIRKMRRQAGNRRAQNKKQSKKKKNKSRRPKAPNVWITRTVSELCPNRTRKEKWTDFSTRAKHLEEVPLRKEFNAQLLQVRENIHSEAQLEYYNLLSTKKAKMMRMKEQHDMFAKKEQEGQEQRMAAWVEKVEQLRAQRLAARRNERMVIRRNLYKLEMRRKKEWAEYEEENQRMEADWARKEAAQQPLAARHGELVVELFDLQLTLRRCFEEEEEEERRTDAGSENTTEIGKTGHARNRTRDGTTTGVARESYPEWRK